MRHDTGVVYVATGDQFVEEANESAASLSENADLPVVVWTDDPAAVDRSLFDEVRHLEAAEYDFGDSVLSLERTPFDRTLFLDTDTYVCGDVASLFDALERFDLLAAHDPSSRTAEERGGFQADVPDAFPQYNTGVVAFRANERVDELFTAWREIYERNRAETELNLNQPAFREALYESDASLGTIPWEFNFRVLHQGSVGLAVDEVRIVHGRHPSGLARIAEEINETHDMRVYTPTKWPIRVVDRRPNLRYLARLLASEDGEAGTLRRRFRRATDDEGAIAAARKTVDWFFNRS